MTLHRHRLGPREARGKATYLNSVNRRHALTSLESQRAKSLIPASTDLLPHRQEARKEVVQTVACVCVCACFVSEKAPIFAYMRCYLLCMHEEKNNKKDPNWFGRETHACPGGEERYSTGITHCAICSHRTACQISDLLLQAKATNKKEVDL